MKEYHMTFHEVMWGISYQNLMLLFADSPFYEPEERTDKKGTKSGSGSKDIIVPTATTPEELIKFLG